MKTPRVTLEQWRVFQAVVDYGGFSQAARQLHRSQSSVSYAVAKLQEQVGIPLLRIEGRKAVLTEAGEVLLRRSRTLLKDAGSLEELARSISEGWESEVRLVVDAAFPPELLMEALRRFMPLSRDTRVQLQEVVLSGAEELLLAGNADLVIGTSVPASHLGDLLMEIEFIAVAHPAHPLHQLDRTLTSQDLRDHMQLVIRDSGSRRRTDFGWLDAEHRWTVTSLDTAVTAVTAGLGFGWLPRHRISQALEQGRLKALPLNAGLTYTAPLYLVFRDQDNAGPATRALARVLNQICRGETAEEPDTSPDMSAFPTDGYPQASDSGNNGAQYS
ncbi:LysR family transcriptional regulator [Thioalkalivibrio sulfidiphilus]|uniref:LysR family transcriptional regulator n=1 Tax=Thioalkalivibrio sulfidiphilus TaxID=1033854 RepID=UPI003B2995B2